MTLDLTAGDPNKCPDRDERFIDERYPMDDEALYIERPAHGGSLATYLSAHRWVCHHQPRCAAETVCNEATASFWREMDKGMAKTARSYQAARAASLAAAHRDHAAIAAGVAKLRAWRTE